MRPSHHNRGIALWHSRRNTMETDNAHLLCLDAPLRPFDLGRFVCAWKQKLRRNQCPRLS